MFISVALTLISSLLLTFCTKFSASFFIIFYATIIFNTQLLSIFTKISPSGYLLLSFIEVLISIFVWVKFNKPLPKTNIKNFTKKLLNSLKLDKSLVILCLSLLFMISVSFLLSAFTPINDDDAKAYHAFRAIMFSDYQKIFHFDTNEIRNLVMPINSELCYCWIYTFTKSDVGFSLVSFFFFIGALFAQWGILSHFKFSFRKKLWATIMFSSLAGVISQASSTQTDIIIGALGLFCVYFFLKNTKIATYLSSLSLALALGTKSTAFMMSFGIFLILFFICKKENNFKKLLNFFYFLTLNFLIFSSYNYILNLINFHNPFGATGALNAHSFWGGISAFVANFLKYNLLMFDFSGFTWGYYLSPSIIGNFNKLLGFFGASPTIGALDEIKFLNCHLTEQTIGFGILGWLVFIPCLICAFFKKGGNSAFFKTLSASFWINLAIMSAVICFMPFSIRFMCAFITLCSPVFVFSYFKKSRFLKPIIILFSIFYLLVVSSNLTQRPFFKLYKQFKTLDKQEFQEKTRCFDFKFYRADTSVCQLKKYIEQNVEPQKIGLFLDNSSSILPLKFLENKGYKIDFLNLYHIQNYNFDDFDTIITNNFSQNISTYSKNDTLGKNIKCEHYDKFYQITNSPKEIAFTRCYFDKKHFTDKNFTKITTFTPIFHKFLDMGDFKFVIFSKPNKSDIIQK